MDLTKDFLQHAKIVTHKNCTDGTGVASLWRRVCKNLDIKDCSIEYITAGTLADNLKSALFSKINNLRPIIAVDVHLVNNDIDVINAAEKCGDIVILDHHQSAKHLAGRDWCLIDDGLCGAQIFFQCIKKFIPEQEHSAWEFFTKLIADRDLWKCEYEESKHLNLLSHFYGQDYSSKLFQYFPSRYTSDNNFDKLFNDNEKLIIKILQENQNDKIKKALENRINKVYQGLAIGITISSVEDVSTLLNRLLNDKSLDIAANINLNTFTVSLRSRGNVDVSEFASKYGGGGHIKAAGFCFAGKKFINLILDEVFDV